MDAKQHAELTALVSNMAVELHTMKGNLAAMTSFFKSHLDRMDLIHEQVEKTIDRVTACEQSHIDALNGFPAKDAEAHRRYHEAVIEARELRNNIMRASLEKLLTAGVFGVIGILATLAWKVFKIQVTQ
jgi:hypothetical protein